MAYSNISGTPHLPHLLFGQYFSAATPTSKSSWNSGLGMFRPTFESSQSNLNTRVRSMMCPNCTNNSACISSWELSLCVPPLDWLPTMLHVEIYPFERHQRTKSSYKAVRLNQPKLHILLIYIDPGHVMLKSCHFKSKPDINTVLKPFLLGLDLNHLWFKLDIHRHRPFGHNFVSRFGLSSPPGCHLPMCLLRIFLWLVLWVQSGSTEEFFFSD